MLKKPESLSAISVTWREKRYDVVPSSTYDFLDGCPEIAVEDHNRHGILRYIETEAQNYGFI
ncbi:hypothetical protein SAMD00023353_9300190 [Rosellinia necatrix]|uniref:Uncharacterized protein n=1 Tax=Rosellinia necatrix TaxID=77044 RepID=A0A1S8ABD9_ROSNE|nr:hypothetical protein SAMD00023353_9300190 [Rosellinia necatrix]